MLTSFCDDTGLKPVVSHVKCSIDYTYNFDMIRFSILDHFLLSGTIFNKSLYRAYVIHDVDNTSDHEPIVLQLLLEAKHIGFRARTHTPHVSWVKANDSDLDNYRCALVQRLRCIKLPTDALLCTDLRCHDPVHFQSVDNYAREITHACIDAAETTIPHSCNRQSSSRIPGWSERVQPLREKSLFWHHLWLECDRPRSGAVADSMRRTRAAYHYAIRQVKRDEESIVRERVANAMLNDGGRNFWSEIKRMRGNKAGVSRTVDGLTDADSIANLFADKYRELYTSVPYNESEMQDIVRCVQEAPIGASSTTDCIINTNDVKTAIARLKAHKNDGSSEFSSDHIVNAGNDLCVHVACLFTAIAVHGVVPDSFRLSTIVPIPKGRNVNTSDSANFRGIAISSIYGKIFDNIILDRYHHKLMSCDLQFGFKAKCSTNMCSMVLKETIAYYVQNQNPVFCTFLDATKAFDRLHYCKLFKLLVKRELPACIIRVLVNLYTQNSVRVAWGGAVSEYFAAVNGVKQGAVLSPVLFCVYIDDLLLELSKAGTGCYIGSNFVGALAYADDIVLVAPTATALRKLLAICEDYAQEYCISFNAVKTKCLVVIPKSRRFLFEHLDNTVFSIDNKPISFVKSFTHLGHIITSELTDDADVIKRCSDFIGQVNNTVCFFRKLRSFVQNNLFRSYCTSYYGCELWRLSNRNIDNLCVAWRKSLRRIWHLPQHTHCYFLPIIGQCLPIYDEICRRSINFVRSCIAHESPVIRFITQYGVLYARSSSFLGENMLFCMQRYNCSLSDLLYGSINAVISSFFFNSVDVSMRESANLLLESLMIRDGLMKLPTGMFSSDELQCIIDYVCTSC